MFQLKDLDFSVYQLVLLLVLMLAWVHQLYFYSRYMTVVLRRSKAERKGKISYTEAFQPVSVVICARESTELLQKFLPEVLTQEYPHYEVIVVNDGANEETEFLLRDLKMVYPHLRSTFVPNGTTNISTKKLALTLGIKAARYDWLLFTDADCIPENKYWIHSMARNFVPGVEIVLGYGAYLNQKGLLNRLITYDTLFIALKYLGFAKSGKPYMGVGRNMAYNKAVFYRNDGFVPNLQFPSGDDDLFVNRAATRTNTRIESSLSSITWSEPNISLRRWFYQKERHFSVSSHYSLKSKIALITEPISRGLFYSGFIFSLLSFISDGYLIVAGVVMLLFLLRFILQLIVISKSSGMFSERKYNLDLLLFDVFLPLVTFHLMVFGRMGKKARYYPWK